MYYLQFEPSCLTLSKSRSAGILHKVRQIARKKDPLIFLLRSHLLLDYMNLLNWQTLRVTKTKELYKKIHM